jgi:MFS family permease
MLTGLLLLTSSWGTSLNGWVIFYAWALFIYGIGVGGEYPMTATSGMENAVGSGKVSLREDRLHRGRKVTSAFLMQGWGQLLNQVILIVILLISNRGGNPPYSEKAAQWTFRVGSAVPALGTAWLLLYRVRGMKGASRQLTIAKRKSNVTGYDTKSLRLTFTYFGPRVLATAGAWFCNDVFFYGNKLFQGKFISAISPGDNSVIRGWHYNLINVSVSLVGYYLACMEPLLLASPLTPHPSGTSGNSFYSDTYR